MIRAEDTAVRELRSRMERDGSWLQWWQDGFIL
jgi:hypothetical protein